MNFIVTGGAGFIGSHVVEQLLLEGHQVTVVDDLVTGRCQNLKSHTHLTLLQKNIADCTPRDFEGPIDGVAHLAATPSVTASWMAPLAAHHNNLSTTVSVIQLCQQLAIPRLVLASSAAVYGDQLQLPIVETGASRPISPYGLQKLVSEQYATLFASTTGFTCVSLRLFNAFGPRQVPGSAYSGVISIFVRQMQQGLPITIYGDGTQTRDFVYVKDVAIAFVKALTVPLAPGTSLTCNIGTGQATALTDLIDVLQPFFPDWHPQLEFLPSRSGDIPHSQADITRSFAQLGFQPQWSLRSGLQGLLDAESP